MEEQALCGKCSKPKGKEDGCCKCGRPSKYSPMLAERVEEYLAICKDKYNQVVKQINEDRETYDNVYEVQLPTIQGFALFLEINETTAYAWADEYPEFSKALDKIKQIQHERLVNHGLSGQYNPTIAKLILSSNHGYAEKTDSKTTLDGEIKVNIEKQEAIKKALEDV